MDKSFSMFLTSLMIKFQPLQLNYHISRNSKMKWNLIIKNLTLIWRLKVYQIHTYNALIISMKHLLNIYKNIILMLIILNISNSISKRKNSYFMRLLISHQLFNKVGKIKRKKESRREKERKPLRKKINKMIKLC